MVGYIGGVLYEPLGLRLLPWQERWLREFYGSVDIETGERTYWKSYTEVCAKNGKSFLCGALPLYHLDSEGIDRAMAFGMASAQKQAGIVYRSAAHLIRENPSADFKARWKINESTFRIIHRKTNGFYRVISADGGVNDGEEPSLAIYDELHRWHTKSAITLYEVMNKGTISRSESSSVEITTAGAKDESPICWRQHERARRILEGGEKAGRLHVMVFAADEKRAQNEPEYWQSKEARLAGNPSHEDHGGFLKDEKIVAQVEEIGKAAYMRLHLGIWSQSDDRWLETGEWARGAVPLRALIHRPCYLGIDLSSTTAMTALVALFPDYSDESYDVLPWFWIPRKRVRDLERRYHVDLERWISEGLITSTKGNSGAVDYAAVEEKIRWCTENFDVQEVCYDPWNATDLVTRLEKEGHVVVKVPQIISQITAPMKHLHRKILEGKVRHDGHEVLSWHANSVVARYDANANVAAKKPEPGTDSYCIDGFSAMLTAMARGMIAEPEYIDVNLRSVSA